MQIVLDGRISLNGAVLALGMFDGVHIGHRVLLRRAKALAHQRGVPLVACTFANHPMALIEPEKCPPMLSTFDERAYLLQKQGVDMLFAQPFDRQMMDSLPEEYIGELIRRFHPTDVVCGYNHSFGRRGEGTPALLHAIGSDLAFQTEIVPKIMLDGHDVSSTVIRGALRRGDVTYARALLARPYSRAASIQKREGNQLHIDFPDKEKQDVASGLYRILWTQQGHTYPAVLSVPDDEKGGVFTLPEHLLSGSEGVVQFVSRADAHGETPGV